MDSLPDTLPEIQDLCSTFKDSKELTQKERFGFTVDEKYMRHHIYPNVRQDIVQVRVEQPIKPYVSKSFLPTDNVPLQDMYAWCFLSRILRLMFQEKWDIAACYFLHSRLHVSKSSQLTQDLPGMHIFPFASPRLFQTLLPNV